jgi:plasmid maintenance system antidote protein VapI
MSLGDAFPATIRAAAVQRQLHPGAVIKIETTMDDGVVHEKRFVVLHVTEHTLACVINSIVPRLVASDAMASRCQVGIDQQAHPFMNWDSHIDCSRIRTYPTAEVLKQLNRNPAWLLGQIERAVRDQIVAALKFSQTIPPFQLRVCCDALADAV